MKATIWGCRGSLPAPAPDTVRYGGNTSCIEVRVDEETVIILDAGSGMRPLGRTLASNGPSSIHVLLTHLHLDHLQGLAFFLPFWTPDVDLHIWGPSSPNLSLADRVAAYVAPPLFPVHLSDVPSRPVFHDVPEDPWTIGSARVTAAPVVHQGPTVGYRIRADERTLAYIPDHEPSLGVDLESLEPEWISGHSLAWKADVLLHDTQYTAEEYTSHVGWGHSSVGHAVTIAQAAAVERLVMFHHDPAHTDDDVEELCKEAAALWAGPRSPVAAAEGMALILDPEGVRFEGAGSVSIAS